jgi:glycosyltransferase involved in cell wall biosynthesis
VSHFKEHTVIILSNENWSDLWLSKHHCAMAISHLTLVYYFNPTGTWNFTNLFKFNYSKKKINDSLYEVSYTNFLPFSTRLKLAGYLNSFFVTRGLKKHLDFNNSICLTFDPFRHYFFHFVKPFKLIYYVVDKYSVKHEKILCEKVNLIFLISNAFKDGYTRYGKPVEVFPHGIPPGRFSEKETLAAKPIENKIILAGSISRRINLELYLELCVNFPHLHFFFYGNIYENSLTAEQKEILKKLHHQNNFFNGGAISYFELQNEILSSKICLSLYDFNDAASSISSLKVLQYMSLGKTILSNRLSFFKGLDTGLIYFADNNNDYLTLFRQLVISGDDKNLISKRINYSKQFSYESIINKMEEFI